MQDETQDKPIRERLDFNKPDFSFIPNGQHEWRQQGYYIICYSCDIQHAVFVGRDKLMTGIDEKTQQPIMKSRKELGMV